MNKRILAVAFCSALGLSSVIAQNQILQNDNINIEVESGDMIPSHATGELNKQSYGGWYNHILGSNANVGIQYSRVSNATLFPDTLVYQLYGAADGGVVLDRTSTHSVGEIIYPQDSAVYLEDLSRGIPQNLSRFNAYVMDSIQLIWRYAHNVPGSVDTLLVQFYNDAAINRYTVKTNKRITAFVEYDPVLNKGPKATYEVMILLDADDTSIWSDQNSFGGQTIAIPDGGLKIGPGGLAGYTISYIPGFEYKNGDTVEFDWEGGAPDKKLNHFITPTFQDNGKVMGSFRSYGTGLSAVRWSRYRTDDWSKVYVPGVLWDEYDLHQNVAFHITSQTFGVDIVEKVNVAVYPNPVNQNSKLYVSSEVSADYKTVQIMDQSGKLLLSSARPAPGVGIDVNLSAGIYFVQFVSGKSTITDKLIVE